MKITYGLATYDRYTGAVAFNVHLPMHGVPEETLYEFLRIAGENGWELCAAFPSSLPGRKRAMPNTSELRTSEDAAEEIEMIFKKVS